MLPHHDDCPTDEPLIRRHRLWVVLALVTGAAFAVVRAQPGAPTQDPAAQPTASEATLDALPEPEWSYEGDEGPDAWGGLKREFAACWLGEAQSPIDLPGDAPSATEPSVRAYGPAQDRAFTVVHTGRGLGLTARGAGGLTIGQRRHDLRRIDVHFPSEHTVEGRSFPLEVQLQLVDAAGGVAVLALLLEEGQENPLLAPLWALMPQAKGDSIDLGAVGPDLTTLPLPRRRVYRYTGSLTTPPCTEGVEWLVAVPAGAVSTAQVAALRARFRANSRPIQPRHDRVVSLGTIE